MNDPANRGSGRQCFAAKTGWIERTRETCDEMGFAEQDPFVRALFRAPGATRPTIAARMSALIAGHRTVGSYGDQSGGVGCAPTVFSRDKTDAFDPLPSHYPVQPPVTMDRQPSGLRA